MHSERDADYAERQR